MTPDLEKRLCEKYPKIFRRAHFCFEHDDGWYGIIDSMCAIIQHRIDGRNNMITRTIEHNTMVQQMQAGDFALFEKSFSFITREDHREQQKNAILKQGFRDVPEQVEQVVASQVKEKFGTLRFYYTGGDEYTYGVSAMAESMSSRTCEQCGAPGKTKDRGWLRTLCDAHDMEKI